MGKAPTLDGMDILAQNWHCISWAGQGQGRHRGSLLPPQNGGQVSQDWYHTSHVEVKIKTKHSRSGPLSNKVGSHVAIYLYTLTVFTSSMPAKIPNTYQ